MTFDDFIKRILEEDKKILEALGSDYDESGVPYWDKWGEPAHKEIIDKSPPSDIE